MRLHKAAMALLVSIFVVFCFSGCSGEERESDFSEINSICELATLKCYYHNVAKAENEASGLFKFLGAGYKKIWTEYSGVVELGIDVNKMSVSGPDRSGNIQITIPDAEVLSVTPDEDSMSEPLTDTGLFTKITKEEETAALAEAQKNMEETARQDHALLNQAKERAKNLIEGYVKNVGEQVGREYTVEWIEAEPEESQE